LSIDLKDDFTKATIEAKMKSSSRGLDFINMKIIRTGYEPRGSAMVLTRVYNYT
jgi:hypothetical protein